MKQLLLFHFVLLGLLLPAQNTINLKLKIFNEFNSESLAFADVKVVNTTTNQKLNKKSNFNGKIEIDLFPEMDYQLFITKETDSSTFTFAEKVINFNTKGVALGNEIVSDVKLRPVFKKEGLALLDNIHFDVFEFALDKQSEAMLDNVVELMQNNLEIELEVNGHASCNLTEADANSVSVERAKAVVFYLTGAGLNHERIKATAWGKTQGVTDCTCSPEKKKDNPCVKSDHLKNSRAQLKFSNI